MNYTQRQLESELSKLVIDLVWSATDGGCKLKESDFSHFEEPLHEWTALVNRFSTSIAQAVAEERERVRGEIEKIYPISDTQDDSCDNFKQKVLDLLSSLQDKESPKYEIPMFEETMEALDKLSIIKKDI